jgi:ABC-type multidrug transport system permease subunit
VPDTAALDPIHQGNAGITAVGFIFSFFAFWIIMRKDRQLPQGGKRQFDRRTMVAAYVVMWVAAVGMLLSQFIRYEITGSLDITDLSFIQTGLPVFLSLPLWEWVFFLSIIGYTVMMAIMVPANVEPLEAPAFAE